MTDLPDLIRNADRFVAIDTARNAAAAEARECQARYKRFTAGFIAATAAAAILGGFILYGLDTPSPNPSPSPARPGPALKQLVSRQDVNTTLIILQAICLAAAAFCGYLQGRLRYDESWLENRMRAEAGRVDRALAALELGYAAGPDSFRAGAAYFSAELVDNQLKYLSDAVAKNNRHYKMLVFIGASIVTIGALAVNLTGIGPSGFVLFAAFVGVVSPAFISALKSWEEASADQDRRKLHAATWDNLNALRAKRQDFTDAIAANDLDKAKAYAEQVMDVLRVDHAAFAALRKGILPVGTNPPTNANARAGK